MNGGLVESQGVILFVVAVITILIVIRAIIKNTGKRGCIVYVLRA